MSEEKKYLLTTEQLGKVMAHVLAYHHGAEEADLIANFMLNSNEYHENTCHCVESYNYDELFGEVIPSGLECSVCGAIFSDAISGLEIPCSVNYCPNCGAKVVEE